MAKSKQKQAGAADAQAGSGERKAARPPIVNGDLYQRANFTLQVSAFLQQLQQPLVSTGGEQTPTNEHESQHASKKNLDMSRLSRNMMAANGKMVVHNQMKVDPSMKRNICSKCSTVLVPGLTSRVRNRPSKVHFNVTHVSCLSCQTRRTIPCPPTTVHDEGLDGPNRSKRRRASAKRYTIPFHEREATTDAAAPTGQKGHTLWQDQTRLSDWGQSTSEAPTGTAM